LGNPRLAANYSSGDQIYFRAGSSAEHGIANNSTAAVLSVDARANNLTVATHDGNEVYYSPALMKKQTGESTVYREEHRDFAVGGNVESRKGAVSLFNGPRPDIKTYSTNEEESEGVASWLRQLASQALQPQEMALFVRSAAQVPRAKRAAELAGINHHVLDEHVELAPGMLSICTMHLAKGLEFRAVGVMACDDEVIPLQERIEAVVDEVILRMSTVRSGNCSTLPVPVPATTSL
jgi:superfamily I DNA/RNA helicase